jgi:fatty acid desaturase
MIADMVPSFAFNVGLHQVHHLCSHLCSGIPDYRLPQALGDTRDLSSVSGSPRFKAFAVSRMAARFVPCPDGAWCDGRCKSI